MSHNSSDWLDIGRALVGAIVDTVSYEHPEGSPYFDKLDELLRDPRHGVFDVMWNVARDIHGPDFGVIVSGNFGKAFSSWAARSGIRRPVLLRGGLRHASPSFYPTYQEYALQGGPYRWVFLDDSLYLGRTHLFVRRFVLDRRREFLGSVVAYDGSRWGFPQVTGLYRYFA